MDDNIKLTTIRLTKDLFSRIQNAVRLTGLEKGYNMSMTAFIADTLREKVEEIESTHLEQTGR